MDDDVIDRLRRAAPRPADDDPEVSDAVRQLVDSVAHAARQRARRRDRAGFAVGITVVAAACAAVVPLLLGQPSGLDGITMEEGSGPTAVEAPPTPLSTDQAPASGEAADCFVESEIVPDPQAAGPPANELLAEASAFLIEQELESVPLEKLVTSTPFSPEGHTAREVEKQAILDIEGALAEAGIYLDGLVVLSKLVCAGADADAGAP